MVNQQDPRLRQLKEWNGTKRVISDLEVTVWI